MLKSTWALSDNIYSCLKTLVLSINLILNVHFILRYIARHLYVTYMKLSEVSIGNIRKQEKFVYRYIHLYTTHLLFGTVKNITKIG